MDLDIKLTLFYGSAFVVSVVLAIASLLVATTRIYPRNARSRKEKFFVDPKSGEINPFPSISDKPTVGLSVIIPAYNEEVRLGAMLDESLEYLEQRYLNTRINFTYEVILVSDGSSDGTVKLAEQYCRKIGADKFRILDLETNRGKGGAVRLGMQSARGALLLFADADGATKFSDLIKLEESMEKMIGEDYMEEPIIVSKKSAICVGSRAHLEDKSVANRSIFRTFLMYGFHALVWLFAVRGIRDTQCGFKLFTRKAAKECFESLHVERWAFDVELLFIAQRLNIPIAEVAVHWCEIDGSKVTPIWSWIQMGVDLILIWLRYKVKAWKIIAENLEVK